MISSSQNIEIKEQFIFICDFSLSCSFIYDHRIHKTVLLLSLSTVVLNSRYQPENMWFPKGMHLDTQWYKIQNMKNLPQCYEYSSNNAIFSFKQAKCCNICSLENFKKIKRDHDFV